MCSGGYIQRFDTGGTATKNVVWWEGKINDDFSVASVTEIHYYIKMIGNPEEGKQAVHIANVKAGLVCY